MRRFSSFLVLALFSWAVPSAETAELPIRGGERVLFIGNSLTSQLSSSLNTMATANGLPTFEGHHVQLWNETLRTHALLSPEQTPENFRPDANGISSELRKLGYKVSGANSLFHQVVYDRPEWNARGYLTALEAIATGTPEGKPWDYVVIQAYTDAESEEKTQQADGTTALSGPLYTYAERLIQAVRAVNAQPLIYAAWGSNPTLGGGPESAHTVGTWTRGIANHQALAEHFHIPLIPVRMVAWSLYTDRMPVDTAVDWLQKDNVHAAACGNAVLHYTMAAVLHQRPAASLNFSYPSGKTWDQVRHYVIGDVERKHGILIAPELDLLLRTTVDSVLAQQAKH